MNKLTKYLSPRKHLLLAVILLPRAEFMFELAREKGQFGTVLILRSCWDRNYPTVKKRTPSRRFIKYLQIMRWSRKEKKIEN